MEFDCSCSHLKISPSFSPFVLFLCVPGLAVSAGGVGEREKNSIWLANFSNEILSLPPPFNLIGKGETSCLSDNYKPTVLILEHSLSCVRLCAGRFFVMPAALSQHTCLQDGMVLEGGRWCWGNREASSRWWEWHKGSGMTSWVYFCWVIY